MTKLYCQHSLLANCVTLTPYNHHLCIIYRPHLPWADIRLVTPSTLSKGLLSAIELDHEAYVRYILYFTMIAAIFTRGQY